jgi:hypothetical protein
MIIFGLAQITVITLFFPASTSVSACKILICKKLRFEWFCLLQKFARKTLMKLIPKFPN